MICVVNLLDLLFCVESGVLKFREFNIRKIMDYDKLFKKLLLENSESVFDDAVRLLVKIAENILNDPSNIKFRTLQKHNDTISKKLLLAEGSIECLKYMGFQEKGNNFTMPLNTSLDNLRTFKEEILKWKSQKAKINHEDNTIELSRTNTVTTNSSNITKVELPPLVFMYTNPFLKRLEKYFHEVLQYENKDLQSRAKKLIPLTTCEEKAQKQLRNIQEHIKKKKLDDPDISIQDTLILELLTWFKEEFFEWVDSPKCSNCDGETSFSHMSTDPNQLIYCDRVELHRCKTCHQFTSFPRYNDLNILLETRRGRCGEWANTFTLFCRSIGWDARFVVDEGDHVWTEVYSVTQKRWLHCDPCENVCDTPLLYESGWNKNITYVMAYSVDEIQDVTWRYTSNHKEVLKRRKNCSEEELISALFKLRSLRQKKFSDARKKYLTNRLLHELVEFLTEKKPGNEDLNGRISGSSNWRLARGEIHNEVNSVPFIWQINVDEVLDNQVALTYSASLDRYECTSGDTKLIQVDKWSKGVVENSGMFRKEEKDWKMVYLARKEGCDVGKISWKVELINSQKKIDTLVLSFNYATFESGLVKIEIWFGKKHVVVPNGETKLTLKDVDNSSLTISATLSGGKGDVAWQHAQLFRQSSVSDTISFSLFMTIK